VGHDSARQVHRSEDVLKARVFSAGVNPPGTLQLMDTTEALDPGVVNKELFGRFSRIARSRERNVSV
jgi:hypothetical protein